MSEEIQKAKHSHWYFPLLSLIFLLATAVYYLQLRNDDVLFMAQLYSFFMSGTQFFGDCMSRPGGLLEWGGRWFTQLFYVPWLGSIMLTLLWIAIFFTLKKAYSVANALSPLLLVPLIALLVSDIDLGYWMYYLKQPGYYFRETLGILSVSLLLLASRVDRYSLVGSLLAAAAYPLIGFYSPLALLCILIVAIVTRRWVAVSIAAAGAILSPLLFSKLYTTLRADEVFTVGFPVFQLGEAVSSEREWPLYVACASLLIMPLFRRLKEPKGKWLGGMAAAYLLLTVFAVTVLEKSDFKDENFHAECKAYRAADESRWDDVLSAARQVNGPLTREMIMLKNIALFNTGDIGNSIYDYDDSGVTPNTDDSLRVHIVNTAGPLIYMHHGMMNFAHRWCTENMVEEGMKVAFMKILVQVSLCMGEYEAAEKYIDMLSRTMYYADWAERYSPVLRNHKLISTYPELKKCRELYTYMQPTAGTDEGLCEKFILGYYSTLQAQGTPYVREVALAYAMMSKDIQRFWPQYLAYMSTHKGQEVPICYQQAAYMYGCLEPQSAPNPQQYGMHFDQEKVLQRYDAFTKQTQQLASSGLSEESIGANLLSEYGDTFWWVYYFNRSSQYY